MTSRSSPIIDEIYHSILQRFNNLPFTWTIVILRPRYLTSSSQILDSPHVHSKGYFRLRLYLLYSHAQTTRHQITSSTRHPRLYQNEQNSRTRRLWSEAINHLSLGEQRILPSVRLTSRRCPSFPLMESTQLTTSPLLCTDYTPTNNMILRFI